jgi:hypothetical protein
MEIRQVYSIKKKNQPSKESGGEIIRFRKGNKKFPY